MTNDNPNHPEQNASEVNETINPSDQVGTKESVDQESGNQNNWMKHRLVKPVAIGAVAIIVLVILINVLSGGGGGNIQNSNQPVLAYSADNFDTVVLSGHKHELDDESSIVMLSLNHSAAAVLTDFRSFEEGGTLWYLNGKNKIKVSDYVTYFYISDNGNAIAYITDYDEDYNSGTLKLFDGKKSDVVDRDVFAGHFHVSPNGKSVAYVKDYEYNYGSVELTGYVKTGKKSAVKLGDYILPIAVADNAKYIYYIEVDENDSDIGNIYVKKGKNETRIRGRAPLDDINGIFNSDYSQLILYDDGRTYISVNGGEGASLGRFRLNRPVQDTGSRFWLENMFGVLALKDLTQTLYYNNDGYIVKIDRNGTSETVIRDAWSARVTDDLGAIVYIDYRDRLVRKSLGNPLAEEQVLAKEARQFMMSNDAKIVYYIDDYDDLYVVKGNSEPAVLASDVELFSLRMSPDGKQLFYLNDYRYDAGTLYVSRNGGKPVRIAEDVHDLTITADGLYYAKDYSGGYFDLYFSKNYKKAELVEQDVEVFYNTTSNTFGSLDRLLHRYNW